MDSVALQCLNHCILANVCRKGRKNSGISFQNGAESKQNELNLATSVKSTPYLVATPQLETMVYKSQGQIPVDKDVVEYPPEDDDKIDDFDEEEDIFKDALEPDNEDELQGNEDDDESDVKEDFPGSGGEMHPDDDDDVDEMDSEEKDDDDDDESPMRNDFPPEDQDIEHGEVEEENPSFFRKFKDFMRSVGGFLHLVDQDKSKET